MSFSACTPVSSGSGFLKASISYLDCAGQAIGSLGYTALTQPGSGISQFALLIITLFIAFHGVRMMFGRTPDMSVALLAVAKIGLVLMLVTSWPAVRTLVAQPTFNGPAELVAETRLQGPMPLVDRLSRADDTIVALTKWGTGRLDIRAGRTSSGQQAASEFAGAALADNLALGLGRLSFLIGAIMSLGLLKLLSGIMIAALPIFAGLLLFDATRGLFWGYLKLIFALFVAGFAVPLLLAAELSLLEPWLARSIQERSAFLATPSAPIELLAMSASFLFMLIGSMGLIAKACFAVELVGVTERFKSSHERFRGDIEAHTRSSTQHAMAREVTGFSRAETLAMSMSKIGQSKRAFMGYRGGAQVPAPVNIAAPYEPGHGRPRSARQRAALSHARRNSR